MTRVLERSPSTIIHRAYSVLNVKAVHEDQRIIEGIASTPTPDRMQDVVELDGIEFDLPLPLLYQHNSRQPIGHVIDAKKTNGELRIKAQIAPDVATFITEAWALIKAKLVGGLSIGFRSLEESYNRDTGGFHFLRTELVEISAVTIPANAEATITAVKSADLSFRAAFGTATRDLVGRSDSTVNRAGVSALSRKPNMTIQEQIQSFENKRAASMARMAALMEKAGAEGRTLEGAEEEEYDSLETEVSAIDGHLVRLRSHEKQMVARPTAIVTLATQEPAQAAAARGGNGGGPTVVSIKSNLPKGTAFARYVMALAGARGNRLEAAETAKQWKDTPEVELILRADTAAGTTTTPAWAGYLVTPTNVFGEFIELLRPATLVGRIPGLRRVPFNITVPSQTAGGLYGWVGEGAKKPVGALAFGQVTLRFAKVAGIIVLTKELVRFSNPDAEAIVRDDMVKGTAQFIDQQFVDEAIAEVANVSPASITNGITPIPASGTSTTALRTDLSALISAFIAANQSLDNAVFLMSTLTATHIGLMQNPLGQPEFPGIDRNGGTLMGIPVIASQSVGTRIILANASEILMAEDPGVTIDVSEQASLIMSTTPDVPPAQALVSLWQNNLVGLRVDRFITWKRARASAVAWISGAAYVPVMLTGPTPEPPPAAPPREGQRTERHDRP
jgi:HK97 family phage major capsid protein/HK97 family phage prohead protease